MTITLTPDMRVAFLSVSADGRAYAYSSSRFLNSLYLVTGLR